MEYTFNFTLHLYDKARLHEITWEGGKWLDWLFVEDNYETHTLHNSLQRPNKYQQHFLFVTKQKTAGSDWISTDLWPFCIVNKDLEGKKSALCM